MPRKFYFMVFKQEDDEVHSVHIGGRTGGAEESDAMFQFTSILNMTGSIFYKIISIDSNFKVEIVQEVLPIEPP